MSVDHFAHLGLYFHLHQETVVDWSLSKTLEGEEGEVGNRGEIYLPGEEALPKLNLLASTWGKCWNLEY